MALRWLYRSLELVKTPKFEQEAADIARAFELSESWNDDALSTKKNEMNKDQQMNALQSNLTQQITRLIQALRFTPEHLIELRCNSTQDEIIDPNSFPLLNVAPKPTESNAMNRMIRRAILDRVGFAPYIQESRILDAGQGVWIDGRAKKGSVVGIYPGLVYQPADLARDNLILQSLYPDDNYMMYCRSDGILLDGRRTIPSTLANSNPAFKSFVYPRESPFGIGHMCNHPPSGVLPNALIIPYDFPAETFGQNAGAFPSELLEEVPNAYALRPSLLRGTYSPKTLMHSALVLTTRTIEDEELFVDYRLPPKYPRPLWYHPVDAEEECRRWSDQNMS